MTDRPETDVFLFIDMHGGDRNFCWIWRGGRGGRDGRPYFAYRGRRYLAYRVVYKLVYGKEIPHGVLARHTCDNPLCCNPWHIVLGSHADNMADKRRRGRSGLPDDVVLAVKRSLRAGMLTHEQIAQSISASVRDRGLHVSSSIVSRINREVAYAEVGNVESIEAKEASRSQAARRGLDGESVAGERREEGGVDTEESVHIPGK